MEGLLYSCRLFLFFFIVSSPLLAQTSAPSAFSTQILSKYGQLATVRSITLAGSAEWTAGSTHESGTASLQASSDGSTTLTLNLNTASGTESRTPSGNSRTCEWVDSKAITHQIVGPDCDSRVPWFAPLLVSKQSASVSGAAVTATDDGQVTANGSTFHQISYRTFEQGRTAAESRVLTEATRVRVLYDPQTLLPASTEYSIHSDNDLGTQIPVKVVYSNYQTVSGLPVPFQIDRYVNGVLQLSIVLNNASLN